MVHGFWLDMIYIFAIRCFDVVLYVRIVFCLKLNESNESMKNEMW